MPQGKKAKAHLRSSSLEKTATHIKTKAHIRLSEQILESARFLTNITKGNLYSKNW